MACRWFRRRFRIDVDTRRAAASLRAYKEQLRRGV